jgi:hypothetical protein
MGIRFQCPHCHGKLHVKSFLAGKQGICPHCEQSLRIPDASESGSPAKPQVSRHAVGPPGNAGSPSGSKVSPAIKQGASPSSSSRLSSSSSPVPVTASRSDGPLVPSGPSISQETAKVFWYVRPPDGGEYGPAEPHIMQQWVSEGRVASEALVWRTGWPQWRLANSVFLELPTDPLASSGDDHDPSSKTDPATNPSAAGRGRQPRSHPIPQSSTKSVQEGAPGTAAPPLTQVEASQDPEQVGAAAAPSVVPESDLPHPVESGATVRGAPVVAPVVPVTPSGKVSGAGRAASRSRRRRGDRKGWWITAVILLALTSVALLITLVVVLMNQTS